MGLQKNGKKMNMIDHCVENNYVLWIQEQTGNEYESNQIF
jgi:hypothetical protein